jgi:hypothetical protein
LGISGPKGRLCTVLKAGDDLSESRPPTGANYTMFVAIYQYKRLDRDFDIKPHLPYNRLSSDYPMKPYELIHFSPRLHVIRSKRVIPHLIF